MTVTLHPYYIPTILKHRIPLNTNHIVSDLLLIYDDNVSGSLHSLLASTEAIQEVLIHNTGQKSTQWADES